MADPVAALATALHDVFGCRVGCRAQDEGHPPSESYLETAAYTLAILSNWTLVPSEQGVTSHRECVESIAALRAEYAALEIRPEDLPQPTGPIARKWWRLGWHRLRPWPSPSSRRVTPTASPEDAPE